MEKQIKFPYLTLFMHYISVYHWSSTIELSSYITYKYVIRAGLPFLLRRKNKHQQTLQGIGPNYVLLKITNSIICALLPYSSVSNAKYFYDYIITLQFQIECTEITFNSRLIALLGLYY